MEDPRREHDSKVSLQASAGRLAEEAYSAMRAREQGRLQLGKAALDAAFIQGDIQAAELAFLSIGFCMIDEGQYMEAITESVFMKELVSMRFGTRPSLPDFSISTGVAYRHLGYCDRSIEFLLEARSLSQSAGDTRSLVISLNNLGIVLADSGEKERAVEQFSEAAAECASINDPQFIQNTRSNLAFALGQLGRDKAFSFSRVPRMEAPERSNREN